MKKNTNVLTYDNWVVLFKAAFKAFPQVWWRIVTINLSAVLMILLGAAIVAGVGLLLFGGMSAVESIVANFTLTQNLTISQWGILAALLFFLINWIIVFGITAKIANYLVIKDYVHKKTTNPFVLFFQTSWSFFWRYVGLGFRNFWYIFWPILVIILLSVIVFTTSFADYVNTEVLEDQKKSMDTVIPIGSEIDLSSFETDKNGIEENITEDELVNLESSEDSNSSNVDSFDDSYYEEEANLPSSMVVGSMIDNNVGVIIGTAIVFFLLFMFIIWRSMSVVFTQAHLIEHGKTAKEAFETSLNLVKGNWWKVFFSVFGFFMVVSVLPGMAFGVISVAFVDLGLPAVTLDILSNIYSWLVVAPLGIAFIYFLMLYLMKQKKIS